MPLSEEPWEGDSSSARADEGGLLTGGTVIGLVKTKFWWGSDQAIFAELPAAGKSGTV